MDMDANNAAALVTTIHVRPGIEKAFAAWHTRMSTAPGTFPGFVSAEIKAPAAQADSQWSVVQHFRSVKEMRGWQCSDAHNRLLEEISAIIGNDDVCESESAKSDSEPTVTEVITTLVKPGSESAYRDWAAKIHSAEAQFPGYRGGFLQPPISDKQPYWTTLVRFRSPEELDGWLNSSERSKLLEEHQGLVQSWTMHRLTNSFAGWFPAESSEREPATTLKQSMVVLLMLFPIVMAEVRYLSPRIAGWPPAISTFFGNAISVALLTWPFMPIAIYLLTWWLAAKKGARISLRAGGYLLIAVLYVIEISALWNLL
jgi:uncharacterized protein